MSYNERAESFGNKISRFVDNITQRENRAPQRRWEKYRLKRAKKRYRYFNTHWKWVQKWRRKRDERKYWQLKMKRGGERIKQFVAIEGLRKPFGSLYDRDVYTWYEIVISWLACLICVAWVCNLIYFTNAKSTWMEMIWCTGICLLILAFAVGLKLWWNWRPPLTKKANIDARLSRGKGFY